MAITKWNTLNLHWENNPLFHLWSHTLFFLHSNDQHKERVRWVKKDEDPVQLVSGDEEKAWSLSLYKNKRQGEILLENPWETLLGGGG